MKKKILNFIIRLKEMMGDNAAMIAWACLKNYRDEKNDIFFRPQPRMKVNEKL